MTNPQFKITMDMVLPSSQAWGICSDPYEFPLDSFDKKMLGDMKPMTKGQVMQKLKLDWNPAFGIVSLNVLKEGGGEELGHKVSQTFVLPDGAEPAFTRLAALSDLHCIVGLYAGSVWLRRVDDPEELNIDADVMGKIQELLKEAS